LPHRHLVSLVLGVGLDLEFAVKRNQVDHRSPPRLSSFAAGGGSASAFAQAGSPPPA
jgi:hypothetical protein